MPGIIFDRILSLLISEPTCCKKAQCHCDQSAIEYPIFCMFYICPPFVKVVQTLPLHGHSRQTGLCVQIFKKCIWGNNKLFQFFFFLNRGHQAKLAQGHLSHHHLGGGARSAAWTEDSKNSLYSKHPDPDTHSSRTSEN